MGFTKAELRGFQRRVRPRSGRTRSAAAVRRHQPRVCGRPPPRPTSPIPATGSTRRCGWPGSSIARSAAASGMTDDDRAYLVARGIGNTNLVNRATARADELTADELRAGRARLEAFVAEHRPVVVAIAGITAYRTAFGRPRAQLGEQPERLGEARLWVVPNPSGLNAHETIASLAAAYAEPARAAGLELTPPAPTPAASCRRRPPPPDPADDGDHHGRHLGDGVLDRLGRPVALAQPLGPRLQRLLVLVRDHLGQDAGRLQQRDQGDRALGRGQPVDQGRPQPVPDLLLGAPGRGSGDCGSPTRRCAARSARRAAPAAASRRSLSPFEIGFQVIGLIRFFTFWPSFAASLASTASRSGSSVGAVLITVILPFSRQPASAGAMEIRSLSASSTSSAAARAASRFVPEARFLPGRVVDGQQQEFVRDHHDLDATVGRHASRPVSDPPTPARQRAAGDRQPRPRRPVGGRQPLVRRRLPARAARPHRLRAPLRARDVPGLGERRVRPAHRSAAGRRRLGQRHHLVRPDQLLRDPAQRRSGPGPVAGGGPAGQPAGRPHAGEPGQPARGGQGGEAAALRQRPVRRRDAAADRADLPRRPPVRAHGDRLDGGPERGHRRGRGGLLRHPLRAEQRGAVDRGRLRRPRPRSPRPRPTSGRWRPVRSPPPRRPTRCRRSAGCPGRRRPPTSRPTPPTSPGGCRRWAPRPSTPSTWA